MCGHQALNEGNSLSQKSYRQEREMLILSALKPTRSTLLKHLRSSPRSHHAQAGARGGCVPPLR